MELRCVKTVAAPSGWHGFSNTGSLPWTDHHSRKMRFVASVCVNASLCFCKVVYSPIRNTSWPPSLFVSEKQYENVTAERRGPAGGRGFRAPPPRPLGFPQRPPLVLALPPPTHT